MQDRAASLGYDWPEVEGVIDKIGEEAGELLEARTPAGRAEEFGDLLMAIVNLGRRLGLDAEASLRSANAKFRTRFEAVLALAQERDLELSRLNLDELDALWREVKSRPGSWGREADGTGPSEEGGRPSP
jgi:ATP diphosphatase